MCIQKWAFDIWPVTSNQQFFARGNVVQFIKRSCQYAAKMRVYSYALTENKYTLIHKDYKAFLLEPQTSIGINVHFHMHILLDGHRGLLLKQAAVHVLLHLVEHIGEVGGGHLLDGHLCLHVVEHSQGQGCGDVASLPQVWVVQIRCKSNQTISHSLSFLALLDMGQYNICYDMDRGKMFVS